MKCLNIKAELARNGMKQNELASKMRISFSALSKKLRGLNEFNASEITFMANLFNVSADYLLENKQEDSDNGRTV